MKKKTGHCRQKGCPNTFNGMIGRDGWGEKLYGDCLPCHMAAQLWEDGLSPEQAAVNHQWKEMAEALLVKTGWTWADLVASYARHPVIF